MKLFILISAFATLLLANSDCKNKGTVRYKGRLEIKGICMNYTIRVMSKNMDISKITKEWTDESTARKFENVFALGSRCNFPDSIDENEEFYFVIDNSKQECMVCEAYYPTPPKTLSIKVVEQ